MEQPGNPSELFNQNEQAFIESLVNLVNAAKSFENRSLTWSRQDLLAAAISSNLDTNKVNDLIDKVFSLRPNKFGLNVEKLIQNETVPSGLVIKLNQHYKLNSEDKQIHTVDTQYISKQVEDALVRLNFEMVGDLDSSILVWSGYRSPIYQAILFLQKLVEFKFDLQRTGKLAALPLYSEHCSPDFHAIDIGLPIDYQNAEELVLRREYIWLKQKAGDFGFHESYPKDNKYGYQFEPWHWKLSKN